jgi:hypothetical protein
MNLVSRSSNNCPQFSAERGGSRRGEQDLDPRVCESAEARARFESLRGCGASKNPDLLDRKKPTQPHGQYFVLEIWFGIWELRFRPLPPWPDRRI